MKKILTDPVVVPLKMEREDYERIPYQKQAWIREAIKLALDKAKNEG